MSSKKKSAPQFPMPSDEELDAYTDAQYNDFVTRLTQHHQKYYPSCTLMTPRRKTPAERERERIEMEEFERKDYSFLIRN